MSTTKSTTTGGPPIMQYGVSREEPQDWKKRFLNYVYVNVEDELVIEVINAAFKNPPEIYQIPKPKMCEEGDEEGLGEDMAAELNKHKMKDYYSKMSRLSSAQVKAYNLITASVEKGSKSETVLGNNKDWADNIDGSSKENGHLSPTRAMIGWWATHIDKRQGSSNYMDRETEKRRLDAHRRLIEIKFTEGQTVDQFHQHFTKLLRQRKEEGCIPELTSPQQVIIYLQAVKENKLFQAVGQKLEDGTWHYPDNTYEIYEQLGRHKLPIGEITPGYKAPTSLNRAEAYVLATQLIYSGNTKDRRDTTTEANSKKPGLQKNGSTILPADIWKGMSREQRNAHWEANKKAIAAFKAEQKAKVQASAPKDDTKSKVVLAVTTKNATQSSKASSTSSAEYSDEEDEEYCGVINDDSSYGAKPRSKSVHLAHRKYDEQHSQGASDDDDGDEYNNNNEDAKRMREFENKLRQSGQTRFENVTKEKEEEIYQRVKDRLERELEARERDIEGMKDRIARERQLLDERDELHHQREKMLMEKIAVIPKINPVIDELPSAPISWWSSMIAWSWPSSKSSTQADGKTNQSSMHSWARIGTIAVVVTAVLLSTLITSSGLTDTQSLPFTGAVAASNNSPSSVIVKRHNTAAVDPTTTAEARFNPFPPKEKRMYWAMPTTTKHQVKSHHSKTATIFNPFSDKYILFDTGAETHVAKSLKFAFNIQPCRPGILGGINAADNDEDNTNSSSLKFDQICSIAHPMITDAVLCRGATANIISPALARNQGFKKAYHDDDDVYTLTHPSGGHTMTFGRVTLGRNGQKSNLYIMDMTTHTTPTTAHDLSRPIPSINLTVAQNKAKYTKKEVSNAEKALRYLDCIGQPPLRKAIEILRATKNAPVSEKDLVRADDIWGPRISYLKGVTTKHTTASARTDTVPAPLVPVDVIMEVDIFFVKKQPFLIGLLLPLDYCMVKPLGKVGGRAASAIAKGLIEMVDKAKSRNFIVGSISSDNEGGIAKQATAQQLHEYGIELSFCGAGQHCPHIERRIQFVKGKFRKHEHRLEYAMNIVLVEWGVIVSVRETNMPRSSSSMSALSPREKFLGRPYDFKLDGRFPFGTYAQTTVRDTDNTAAARTEGCIILCPKDNLTGTMWALNIHTQSIVTRDHFYEVPLSDALIAHMNDLAAEDGLSRGSDAFHESEYGVQEDNNATDITTTATTMSIIPEDAPLIPATVRFQAYNHDTTPSPATNNAETAVVQAREALSPQLRDETQVPAVGNRGAPDLGYDNRVTVVDVEEGDDDYANDYDVSTPPPTTISRSSITRPLDTLNIPIEQAQPYTRTEPPTTATRRGIQLRGTSRGDKQTNSLASLQTNILFGQKKSQKSKPNYVEVGENFQDSDFERRFNAQLVHTQNWRDRSFALVVSWQRAIKTHGEVAARSIRDELQQMIDKKVWHPLSFKDMTKQQRLSAIRAKMFVTEKFFPNGLFEKIKSRLVARGDMQDRSLYGENDTSAPTAELSSVLSVAAIAACESRYVATCDIGGAFLNAEMFKGSGRKVIVKLDKHVTQMLTKLKPDYESFVGDDGYLFVELDKAMYGCIESAKLWFDHLRNILVNDMGFSQNVFDQCTFNKTDAAGYQVTIIMHVDDMLITCANKFTLDWVLDTLALKFPETKCHYGPCVPFLGMDMDFTVPGDVRITMQGAETDILATAGPIGDRETKSPALENLFEVNANSELVGQSDQDWFRSNVAKLLYLGKRARPEILTATSFLATRAAKADEDDLGKLRRVLRYIRDSPNRGIRLSPGAHGIHVRAYVDAAYGVHMDGKSHTGVSIVLGESGPIFVRSTKQPIVAKSSTESELIATSDSANQVFHVRNFIIAQGHGDQPATIFQDNLSCMALIAKGKSTSMRTRHIQIRYFWVKERVDNGEAVITHMCSEAMGPANALTKPLVGSQFVEERQQLTNWD